MAPNSVGTIERVEPAKREFDGRMIVLFDGVCGLCDRSVQFILKHDKRDKFRFATLQSDFAHRLLETHGKDASDLDTVYLVLNAGSSGERLLCKGRAAMRVLRELGGVWWVLSGLGVLPTPLLNLGYRFVATNRYRWFGKLDSCRLPTPADRAKFI